MCLKDELGEDARAINTDEPTTGLVLVGKEAQEYTTVTGNFTGGNDLLQVFLVTELESFAAVAGFESQILRVNHGIFCFC